MLCIDLSVHREVEGKLAGGEGWVGAVDDIHDAVEDILVALGVGGGGSGGWGGVDLGVHREVEGELAGGQGWVGAVDDIHAVGYVLVALRAGGAGVGVWQDKA